MDAILPPADEPATVPGEHAPRVMIYLLDGFRVTIDGHELPRAVWRRRKAESLVKLLALAPRHALHREQIIDVLWPDLDLAAGANNLRYTVHLARRILSAGADSAIELLQVTGDDLTLAPPDDIWIDIETFEGAAAQARESREPDDYRAAIALYVGELLPEDRYDDWTIARSERLRETYLDLLLDHANACDHAGDEVAAIDALQRIVALDPAHEDARAGLMRLYARGGRRQQALRQYHQLTAALREELDVEPSPASQQLYLDVLTGQEPVAAPTPDVPGLAMSPSHNLPPSLSTFIGRERDLEQLRRTLDSARLVTLTGPGGSGKTRLAVELGRGLPGRFPDGVWFVDLASLTDPDQVEVAVAAVLDIASREEVELIAALRDKRLLLVLDNCEHLIDACASLATDLLAGCPGVQILTTSREALRVSGELVWQVPPLAVPDALGALDARRLAENESVRLFVTRVRAIQHDFALSDDNAAAVVAICRQLDGLPLALELAAARVPALGVAPLAIRLEHALQVLSSGSRAAPPRQQTLRATLDWSHALLDEPEQRLFRRLAVFTNGWTLDAAEALTANTDLTSGDMLSLLAQLVEKSLVLAQEQHGRLRYRMLTPVRQYALERLDESGEQEVVRRRHAELLLAFAEAAEPHLRGPNQAIWVERVAAEHDNLRAALNWAQDADPPLALRLAVALGRFWYVRGDVREGIGSLREALAAAPDAAADLRARGLYHAGILVSEGGDNDQAATFLEQALGLFRQAGDPVRVASVLNSLGVVERSRGNLPRARILLEESLTIRRELGDPGMVDIALGNLALLAWSQGDLDRAETLLEETHAFALQNDDDWSIAIASANLGRIAWERGQNARALDLFSESLSAAWRVGDQGEIAEGLEGLAGVLGAIGDPAGAARLWGAAEAFREALDLPIPQPERVINDRMIANAAERLDAAAFAAAWAEGRRWSIEDAIQQAQRMAEQAASAPSAAHTASVTPALTDRQHEIALLIADGQTNQQIAATLGIAPRTADTHVGAILRRLGLTSRSQVAEWLTTHGLAPNQARDF